MLSSQENSPMHSVGGHSAGAHVLVEYLKAGCGKFKAQVLMSPVDGVDAAGLIPIFCITPGQTLNYAMPTLHLAAGLDNLGGKKALARPNRGRESGLVRLLIS